MQLVPDACFRSVSKLIESDYAYQYANEPECTEKVDKECVLRFCVRVTH